MKITRYEHTWMDRRAGFIHAFKGGRAVLRKEASWRTVSGIYFSSRKTGWVIFEFRRVFK